MNTNTLQTQLISCEFLRGNRLNQDNTDSNAEHNNAPDLTSLGPYSIESRLGQGGMGIVYLATDKDLGRPVAIKVLHPHLLKHENLKQRFRREARMHAKLMHPNIVTLLSLYEDETYMALIMEVVKGDDLKAFLRKNPNLSIKKKLRIAIEILKGLEAAHEFGMVHRDLKPANVLVSDKDEVKLLDFGLAKPEQGGEDLTQSGATVGSFRYMAPEQILNNPLDARTDLYAFGILLFYMLIGKLPFDSTSSGGEFEIMEKQVREPAPVPHELESSIPIPLSNLILKLLEKNKIHRPENAKSVRLSIEGMLEQLHFLSSPAKHQKAKKRKDKTPVPHPSSASNHQIAKQWMSYGRFLWQKFLASKIPNIKKSHADLSIVAVAFILLGSLALVVLNMAENTVAQTELVKDEVAQQTLPVVTETIAAQKKATNATVKKEPKEVKATVSSPPAKPIKQTKPESKPKTQAVSKSKPKKKYKPKKKVARSLTYSYSHQVKRKDKSKVAANKPHEFRGGSHLFYPELAKKSWLSSFKRGDSAVLFNSPVSLSKIVIHKASVGDSNFKNGFIQVEVKPVGKRKWKEIFEQRNKDIEKKITISGFKAKYPSIEGVRIKFKTQDPITIGPIDLLK